MVVGGHSPGRGVGVGVPAPWERDGRMREGASSQHRAECATVHSDTDYVGTEGEEGEVFAFLKQGGEVSLPHGGGVRQRRRCAGKGVRHRPSCPAVTVRDALHRPQPWERG